MSHDVAYNLAFAKQALILAGERLDRVEAALAKKPTTKTIRPKSRRPRRPKPAPSREEAANA